MSSMSAAGIMQEKNTPGSAAQNQCQHLLCHLQDAKSIQLQFQF